MKCAATQGAAAMLIPVNSTNHTATLEATQDAAATLIPVNSTNQTATLEATHDAAAVLIPGNSTDQTATLEAMCPGCRQCSLKGRIVESSIGGVQMSRVVVGTDAITSLVALGRNAFGSNQRAFLKGAFAEALAGAPWTVAMACNALSFSEEAT